MTNNFEIKENTFKIHIHLLKTIQSKCYKDFNKSVATL